MTSSTVGRIAESGDNTMSARNSSARIKIAPRTSRPWTLPSWVGDQCVRLTRTEGEIGPGLCDRARLHPERC
jgi:hypothetical protein